MKKIHTIAKNQEFQNIIKSRQQVVSSNLVIYYRINKKHLRIGISVSKKFANAVKRNFYRRQIRNIFDQLDFWNKPYDIILILRAPFLKLSFLQKKNEIIKTLGKVLNG